MPTARKTAARKAPTVTRADLGAVIDKAKSLEPEALKAADVFPLSQRATTADLCAAGIVNGMPAEEVEARLSKVMT